MPGRSVSSFNALKTLDLSVSAHRFIRSIVVCLFMAFIAFIQVTTTRGDDRLPPILDRTVEFTKDIKPIFVKYCESCHGPEKQLSGFRIDREADALRGGDSGKAFEPGKSSESLLMKYIAGLDPDILMPPEGDLLNKEQVSLVRTWIDQGAKWGKDDIKPVAASAQHWSFQPIRRPAFPENKNSTWARNPIDRFVLARLEKENIEPSVMADRTTLIRRLSLDLLGLPPTLEQIQAFELDASPNAYELLVEELLASPHFGERWGRHWLDLARYADSDGYEKDSPRPHAWRYRDWVIDAVNRDLPFNQFTVEQLAGDLLPEPRIDQRIATGFHRNTLTNKEGGVDPEEFRVAAVVDRVNTTSTVWLGLTMGCAQCHTHKYDPLTLREYYGLFAFFNQGDEFDLPAPFEGDDKGVAPTIRETESRRQTFIHLRGDFLRHGDSVEPHTPEVLPPLKMEPGKSPGRLDLARWIVDPQHPLTPRVTVNRIWRHLFGQGLVTTDDDFGIRGALPSDPDLLNWLAAEFTLPTLEMLPPPRKKPSGVATYRGPWSLKRLIKIIVCSATYRQQSIPRADLIERDPRNVWLARQGRHRLEAEVIRDQALFVSGLLNTKLGGPSVRPPQPAGVSELTYAGSVKWIESKGADRYRRGMYTWFQRTSPYPMLMTFDAPESNVTCTRRERSNTPLQSLTLLNDPVFFECAQHLGKTVFQNLPKLTERIELLYQKSLSRVPSDTEKRIATELYESLRSELAMHPEAATLLLGNPGVGEAQLSPQEQLDLAATIGLSRVMLNLDEFLTRN